MPHSNGTRARGRARGLAPSRVDDHRTFFFPVFILVANCVDASDSVDSSRRNTTTVRASGGARGTSGTRISHGQRQRCGELACVDVGRA